MSPLKLPDTLLHDQANTCLAQWMSQLPAEPPAVVVMDASELSEFDSSALAVLLGLRRVLAEKGSALTIQGMTPGLAELASLYGVLDLLPQV